VNNLSDSLSSLITILGTKIANKRPDKDHPQGHGRMEYVTSFILGIVILILAAGAMYSSITKIISTFTNNDNLNGEEYTSITSIIILGAAIGVKLFLGIFNHIRGNKLKSDVLKATGVDSFFDASMTSATLIGVIVFKNTGVSIDGWLGVIISLMIFKTGFSIVKNAIDELLGKKIDYELVSNLKEFVNHIPGVLGVYDLFLDSYGPNKIVGACRIEIDASMKAKDIDLLSRRIAKLVEERFSINLLVGIYSFDTSDKELVKLREDISLSLLEKKGILQVHGFSLDKENNVISIDVVLDFDALSNEKEFIDETIKEIEAKYPTYKFVIVTDIEM
jgi:cation diffusion facilitator family transporter